MADATETDAASNASSEYEVRGHTFTQGAQKILADNECETLVGLMATVESVDEVSELTLSRICYDKRSALDACQLYKSLD